jgi:hypothetical protein
MLQIILGFRKGPIGAVPKNTPSKNGVIWRWETNQVPFISTYISGDDKMI